MSAVGRFTAASAGFAALLWSQGMIGRRAPAVPRPKPSGRIFPVSFTNVAAGAGLRATVEAGGDSKKYILESIGLQ